MTDQGNITVTEADDGQTFEVSAGDTLLLHLSENATTGYRWAIEVEDADLVDIQEGKYIVQSDTVGSGGMAQWILHAKGSGITKVKGKLWRRWEGDRSAQRRFEVTLRIDPLSANATRPKGSRTNQLRIW